MSIGPYEVLDIARDATTEQIRKAYKRLAKTTHPDQGGHADSFALLKFCHDLLVDPERRKRYDETGVIDEGKKAEPTLRQRALAKISMLLPSIIQAQVDPLTIDLIGVLREAVQAQLGEERKRLASLEAAKARVETLSGRFEHVGPPSDDNLFESFLTTQLDQIEQGLPGRRLAIEECRAALDILAQYRFIRDIPLSAIATGLGTQLRANIGLGSFPYQSPFG